MKVTRFTLDPINRNLRIAFGLRFGRWYARIDLWWIGCTFTR